MEFYYHIFQKFEQKKYNLFKVAFEKIKSKLLVVLFSLSSIILCSPTLNAEKKIRIDI